MTVQLESRHAAPGSVVVPLRGELDVATADRAADRALDRAIPGSSLILDASRVTFCDCSGLSALLRAARRARAMGCGFALMTPSPPLTRLLAITGVGDRLPVLDEPIAHTHLVPVRAE